MIGFSANIDRACMAKTKKWWFCFYTHSLNTCVVAAWRVHVDVGASWINWSLCDTTSEACSRELSAVAVLC